MVIKKNLVKFVLVITLILAIANIIAMPFFYHWSLGVILGVFVFLVFVLYLRKAIVSSIKEKEKSNINEKISLDSSEASGKKEKRKKTIKESLIVILIFLILMFLVSEAINPAGIFGIQTKELPEPAVSYDFDNASQTLEKVGEKQYYPAILGNLTNKVFHYNSSGVYSTGDSSLEMLKKGNLDYKDTRIKLNKGDYIRTKKKNVKRLQTQDQITYVVKFKTNTDSYEYMALFSNQMDWDSNSIQIKEGAIKFSHSIKNKNDSGANCHINMENDYTDGKVHTAVFSINAGENPDCRAYVDNRLVGKQNTDAAEGHFWWEEWKGFVIGSSIGTESRTLGNFYEGEILEVEVYNYSLKHKIKEEVKIKGLNTEAKIYRNPKAVEGKFGDALKFDGNDQIEINFSYQPGSFTQMAWIYSENESFGHSKIPYDGRWITRNKGEMGGLHMTGNGKAGYRLQYTKEMNNTKINFRPAKIENDNWYHLVASFDNETYKLKVYLNGKLKGTKQLEKNAILKDWKEIFLGGAGNYWYVGKIDDFRVYEKPLDDNHISYIHKDKNQYLTFNKSVAPYLSALLVILILIISFIEWKNAR